MSIFIGVLLIFWGSLVLYSSLFKMKQSNYKDNGVIGVSGYIEFEFLLKLLSRLPSGVIKAFTLFIGITFVTFGTIMII
ncbi:hypothetical protein [Sutcliffiella halmapala]|uniref:hypothetical protein n=1 Tax=Sutcliffiella halmapala TaxID=79882 RepID=UPI000995714C|nr:hypothetical protein [Sutcliffiella halmapala]